MTPVRRALWHHPELTAAAGAACAWMLLLLPAIGGGAIGAAHARAHEDAPLLAGTLAWLLMVTAMMVPTALPAARYVGLSSLWRRRQRTIFAFLAGYVAAWGAFGAVAVPAAAVAQRVLAVTAPSLLAGVLAAAALWELTPWKWRFVRACHVPVPLPPAGRRADAASVVGGALYGGRCMGACWPAMVAMAIAGHAQLGLMALLSVVLASEKLVLHPARLARPAAAMLAGAVLVTLAAA